MKLSIECFSITGTPIYLQNHQMIYIYFPHNVWHPFLSIHFSGGCSQCWEWSTGGITDKVLLRTWHMESREWLPNATLPSVINLSCCHWLQARDSPHDSRRVTSARTTRGLSPRPWRHCREVRSVQVHSMWINTMWISHSFRRAAAGSTETTNSPTLKVQQRHSFQSTYLSCFKYMDLT